MDNVREFPKNGKKKKKEPSIVDDAKEWLNKPMQDTTIGDTLLLHTGGAVISIVVGLTVTGWIEILRRSRERQNT